MAGELQLGGSTVATHTGSGASAVVTIDNGVKFPAGHVIETKQYLYRTSISFNHNSGNYTMLSGFEVTTNALMDNVKFYISYDVSAGVSSTNDHGISASIFKDSDSTPLSDYLLSIAYGNRKPTHGHSPGYINNTSNNQYRMFLMRGAFLYTSTLAANASITFKIGVFQHDITSQSAYINVTGNDSDVIWLPRSVSQLTVQQIAV